MKDQTDSELIDIGELDPEQWNEYAIEQGWSDGLPVMMPTQAAVERFTARVRGQNEPIPAVSPRQVTPTLAAVAANAVMAGCKPEYFPVVLTALRAVLTPEYNLHGTLATTHPCAPMVLVNGPIRHELQINCAGNCFGQGWRANASIGRALQLTLLNIGGARPGATDRATQGSAAKFSYCFGENEEQSPWAPFHVRHGFDSTDSVVTVMAAEPPHNINDHASTSADGILTTVSNTISQPGANTIYGNGPYFLALGPEHAQTLARDGVSIQDIQQEVYHRSRVHISRISPENHASYAGMDVHPVDDYYHVAPSPEAIHVIVAGGAGKHSAFIPSFGGTAVCSLRVS